MKLALVTERFRWLRGGAERSTYEMARSLARLGVEVTLVTAKAESTGSPVVAETPDVPWRLIELGVSGSSRVRRWQNFCDRLQRHLSRGHYDVVHCLDPVPLKEIDIYQPRGGSILWSTQRHIASYGSRIFRGMKSATSKLNRGRQIKIDAEKDLCQQVDGAVVAALSSYVADQFRRLYGMPDSRLKIVRNGVATATLCNEKVKQEGHKLRTMFDPQGELAIFVFAAENYQLKGLSWLIRAAAIAARKITDSIAQGRNKQIRMRDFRLLVIGSDMYGEYYQQARQHNLTDRIIFMGHTQKLPAVIAMADAVILPSYNDACSRIILEALAVDTPCITTSYNGAADFLIAADDVVAGANNTGKYGIVINTCNDDFALAEGILTMCQNEKQAKYAHAIKADNLASRVSMDRHARELLDLYNSCC